MKPSNPREGETARGAEFPVKGLVDAATPGSLLEYRDEESSDETR